MKFDAGKAWPHPVLRPPSYEDDYPYSEFEVDIEVNRVQGGAEVEVNVKFELSDPDLLKLVQDGTANYVLLIKAPTTHFRESIPSETPKIMRTFKAGDLAGRAEFAPFLVCTQDIIGFAATGWHSDFQDRTFDIVAGSVLAEDLPKDYWIDVETEHPIGSIFGHRANPDQPDGHWKCLYEEDRVWISMSTEDAKRYDWAREQSYKQPEGHYLMNGLYLPALLAVLTEVDFHTESYHEYQWFSSLNQRLEEVGCKPVGSNGVNRVVDAQKILDSPFTKMPLLAQAEISNK